MDEFVSALLHNDDPMVVSWVVVTLTALHAQRDHGAHGAAGARDAGALAALRSTGSLIQTRRRR